MKTKFMISIIVQPGCIVVGSDEIEVVKDYDRDTRILLRSGGHLA